MENVWTSDVRRANPSPDRPATDSEAAVAQGPVRFVIDDVFECIELHCTLNTEAAREPVWESERYIGVPC
jgi:hypothetical protein